MKLLKIFFLTYSLISTGFSAQENYILYNYIVTIHGTSNLHNWDETVKKVTGNEVINWNKDGSFDINAVNIRMDVHSIKSDHSVMDNKTYDALKADANPEIIFTLSTPVKSIRGNSNTVSAQGDLTIAGVTKRINMQVTISKSSNEKLVFEGSLPIKMSDYNVDPPTALFGMLKTGDNITLSFKMNFIKH